MVWLATFAAGVEILGKVMIVGPERMGSKCAVSDKMV